MNQKHHMSYGRSGCKSVALLVGFCAAVSALAATPFDKGGHWEVVEGCGE